MGDHNLDGVPGALPNGLPGALASLTGALSVSLLLLAGVAGEFCILT